MRTSIRLDAELEKRLDLLAKKTGRSKTSCMHEIVKRGLAEAEDYYFAASTLERVGRGEESIHSAAEVRRLLDSDD
ncbi:MAG: CopG family transcriptional regulator [Alphaproteobacteria bacterium HGW-Alphaproteobacteria-12]|nr:MAG: CopG family transcriptional regulator [Alphaproteobacteria bacterium HGW-Alphaproteobacteria-12]